MNSGKTLKIVYPLISGPEDEHSWMCFLSVVTARHFHPQAQIFCVCDDRTHSFLTESSHPLCHLVTIVPLGDLGEDGHLASRRAKFRGPPLIEGSCLELDADTVFINPFEGFSPLPHHLAICREQVDAREMGHWLDPVFRNLGWPSLTEYYNAGVLYFDGDFNKVDFFKQWERAYMRFLAPRRRNDQPSLAHVLQEMDFGLTTLPERYNFSAYLSERGRNSACILHFWASDKQAYSSSRYALIVRMLRRNPEMPPAKIVRLLRSRKPLYFGHHLNRHLETWNLAGFLYLGGIIFTRKILSLTWK